MNTSLDPQPRAGHADTVLFAVSGRIGVARLNRPQAINALDLPMVDALDAQLADWAVDDAVDEVVLTGAGDRGLCSGGDVRSLRDAILAGEDPVPFWEREYRLNARIAHFPKPYFAIMDGIVMGGGLGLAAHGSARIVTERSRLAMPETIIGFFPDVGMSYLLARAPGETGTHLALTGTEINGPDALAIGLADVLVPSESVATDGDVLELVVRLHQGSAGLPTLPPARRPEATVAGQRRWIDRCYRGDDGVAILDRLAADPDPAAREAAATVRQRSPLSVLTALTAIRRARSLDLDAVLAQDLRLARAFAGQPDLLEGVRAQLVDRDHHPVWRYPALSEVPPGLVESLFTA